MTNVYFNGPWIYFSCGNYIHFYRVQKDNIVLHVYFRKLWKKIDITWKKLPTVMVFFLGFCIQVPSTHFHKRAVVAAIVVHGGSSGIDPMTSSRTTPDRQLNQQHPYHDIELIYRTAAAAETVRKIITFVKFFEIKYIKSKVLMNILNN